MKFALLFILVTLPCHVYSDVERPTKERYWEASFKEMAASTIIGTFERDGILGIGALSVTFYANSTCDAKTGENYSMKSVNWKQRDDGEIHVERKATEERGDKTVRFQYIEYLKGNTFIWNEVSYYDALKRVM